jgi:hypothetical protein
MAERQWATTDGGARSAATRPRQAVVLIHGIGEQRPMDTLRGFVRALLKKDTYYSKPDELSDSFELRRLKLRRAPDERPPVNERWPDTDFYEYYWAHHMYGTVISHIATWLFIVMYRGLAALRCDSPRYHRRLRWLVPLTWAVALVAFGAAVWFTVYAQQSRFDTLLEDMGFGVAMVAIAVLVWKILRKFMIGLVLDFVGDAARYFDVNPRNVARRYDILRGGVDMLRKLHHDHDEEGAHIRFRYGRVVIIGHSLGSVIAYDILRQYFHEVNGKLSVSEDIFTGVENFSGHNNGPPAFEGATPYSDPREFRRNQRDAWRQLAATNPSTVILDAKALTTPRWIVSDFVTLGSPLAYAPILLARGIDDLKEKIRMRELPTCPPDRSHHSRLGRFTIKASEETDRIHDQLILQHHAFFAVTRWTNFYFERDPVGGSLGPNFGNGIKDVALRGTTLLAHVSYWHRGRRGSARCIAGVRRILQKRVT